MGLDIKQIYLVVYNTVSAVGWAYCLYLTIVAFHAGETTEKLWVNLAEPLTYVQTAAIMEVVHAALGVVKTPLAVCALQVASRLLLVWVYTRPHTACQNHWSLLLMVASWSLAEIPRYLFYTFKQFGDAAVPHVIFWLRYSGFIVLYPTGITGECLQMYTYFSSATREETLYWVTVSIALVYFIGSPYMVGNMWSNRKKAFRDLATAAAKKDESAPLLHNTVN